MATIILHLEGGDQKFALESAAVTLGRGLESDIRLKDIKASRRHCQIVKTPQGFQLVDLSSGNGTYVNGVQAKQQKLNPGDKIQIGSTTLTFHDGAAAPAPEKPVPAVRGATEKRAAAQAGTAKVERQAGAQQTAVAATAVTTTVAPKPPPAPPVPAATPRPPAAAPPARASAPALPAQAAKKSTGSISAAKPPSGPFKKGSSALLKKGGPAGRSTRIGSRPGTAARPAPEGGAKKKSPALLLVGGLVVLGLAGGAFFFLRGSAGSESQKGKKEAGESHKKKDAAKEPQASTQEPKSPAGNGGHEAPGGGDFNSVRNGIAGSCKLGEAGHARWGAAIKEWKDYLERKPSEENRTRAQAEIGDLNAKAKDEFGRLSQQVEGLSQDKKKAEALGLLKESRARFEGTDTLELLDKLIRDFEK